MELTIVQKIAIIALPLIFAITLHEVAHGFIASLCGDQTAKRMGRLSINPIKHIDLIGTVLLPLLMMLTTPFIFGWAKPVPVDPRNFKNPRRDTALVALAGPLANFIMATAWAGLLQLGQHLIQLQNTWYGVPLTLMGTFGVQINVVLGVLNLLPIPPLDGGNFLMNVLPPRMAYSLRRVEPYGFIILVILLVTGLLSSILGPIVDAALSLYGLR